MNLGDLQQYIWTQTDTTSVDLPGATIAAYLDEAFARTIAAENDWPFYEQTWNLVIPAGQRSVALPAEVVPAGIMAVSQDDVGMRLQQIGQEEAESRFPVEGLTQRYVYYSVWGQMLHFWPSAAAITNAPITVRGYRRPVTTFRVDTGQVDADERLHRPLAHYAIALAYAREEDEVLEKTYMERWQRDVEMARQAIMEPPRHRPVVMHGNWPRRTGAFAPNRIGVGNWRVTPP